MDVKVERKGSDKAEIYADDRVYYEVDYSPTKGTWVVTRLLRGIAGIGHEIGTYGSAKEAVNKVTTMLNEKSDELTDALKDL